MVGSSRVPRLAAVIFRDVYTTVEWFHTWQYLLFADDYGMGTKIY